MIYSCEELYVNVLLYGESSINRTINSKNYNDFSIPKRGGMRHIHALKRDSNLFELQKNLCLNFLGKITIPNCAKGFIKGCNYKDYLYEHKGAKFFLRIDINDFFGSIKEKHIKNALSDYIFIKDSDEKKTVLDYISKIVLYEDKLPQGATSSPVISNIVFSRLDQRIRKYSQSLNITYTRYADDLLFSSKDFDFKAKKWFLKKIRYILLSDGFKLNYSKIKYGLNEISLNGFVISEEIRLSRDRLSDVRHVTAYISQNIDVLKKNGAGYFLSQLNELPFIHRDLERYPFKNIFQLNQYLAGYRSFLISWIDVNYNTLFQKSLRKSISRIERVIDLLISTYENETEIRPH